MSLKRARDSDAESDDEVAAVGLGDIMGHSKLPTTSDFTPLQRVVLSANGNLQRLVSSYHNTAVTVTPRYNRSIRSGLIEREVELTVHGTVFAVATSTVRLESAELITAVEERGLAIGQLFRHLNIMPSFELRDAGHLAASALTTDGPKVPQFYREYTLAGTGVTCQIREVLRADLFSLRPAAGEGSARGVAATMAASMGDIMAPNVTHLPLPDGFAPCERLLLTANGNLERILSSYYARPLQLYVSMNHKRNASVFDRQVALLLDGRQLMLAKSTVFITSREWQVAVERDGVDVGGLLRHFSELPTFTLHSTGTGGDFFWRQYQLKASGMACEINETFPKDVFDELPSVPADGDDGDDGGRFGGI